MAQQLSLSIGAGSGALVLHLAALARGATAPAGGDFTVAFLFAAAMMLMSALAFVPLAADAGAELSGQSKTAT
jgi:hypothetical protein